MGQTILQGCEMNCQKMTSQQPNRGKSQVYFCNLANQLPAYSENQNLHLMKSIKSAGKHNQFLLEIKQVPTQYLEFINHLYMNNRKFQDAIFPSTYSSISWGNRVYQNEWIRLEDLNEQIADLYKTNTTQAKSKVCKVLEILEHNYGFVLPSLKPIYVSKVGLLVCVLYINGVRQQIIVDSQIPVCKLKYYRQKKQWYLLIEKAFAKILGNYQFIEDFTVAEIFQEITGLPYELLQKDQKFDQKIQQISTSDNCSINDNPTTECRTRRDKKISSFKEVIQNQKVYMKGEAEEGSKIYSFRCYPNYSVKAIPLSFVNKPIVLFRIRIQYSQQISLRVSTLNKKYQMTDKKTRYSQCSIKLYRQGANYELINEENLVLENNVYLGKTFIEVEMGYYLLYIRKLTGGKNLSLVCYSQTTPKFKEVHSRQKVKQICSEIARSQSINSFSILN